MNSSPSKKILNQSFPKAESCRQIFIQALFIAVAVYLFLILFQPFGTYTFHHSLKYIILIPYAIIVFVIFSMVKILLKKFSGQLWKVSDELLSIAGILGLSSVLNYFYNMIVIRHSLFDWSDLGFMILFTFALGIPIFAIYFFAVLNLEIKEEPFIIAKNSEENLKDDLQEDSIFEINDLKIKDGRMNFIFAKSEGNYCTIYYQNDSVIEKKLIRISLSNLENQLSREENIVRCHRSFLVNKLHIISKKGNAQGLKLKIKNMDEQIPVSRNYLQALN